MILSIIMINYILSVSITMFCSTDLDRHDIKQCLLQNLVLSGVLYYIAKQFQGAELVLSIIFAAVFFAFAAFPLLYKVSGMTEEITFRHEPKAIAVAECFWLGINLLLLTCASLFVIVAVNAAILVIMLLMLAVQLIYYWHYGICLDTNAITCLMNTHKEEVKEFTADKRQSICGGFAIVVIAAGVLAVAISRGMGNSIIMLVGVFFYIILAIVVLCSVFLFNRKSIILKTYPMRLIQEALQYKQYLKRYTRQHIAALQRKYIEGDLPADFGTILVVVGESANRQHMKAFNKNYDRETTPWLSQMQAEKNLICLPNSFSSFPQTVAALSLALTSSNQYNGEKLEDCISIVDMARACGFATYWYSNQGYTGSNTSFNSIIGSSADNSRWMLQDFVSSQYDEALLDYLKRVPQDGKNKFIVLHLKGSHEKYRFRYPRECNFWDDKEDGDFGKNAYDNSILYTDRMLQKAYQYAKEKLNLQAMIYFSDHGAEIGHGRSPRFTGLGNVRIPAFVWLSDEYIAKYSETYKRLIKNAEQYFTNDLIFDLLGGIMQMKKSTEEKKYDICSDNYKINKNNALTNMGITRIIDCERSDAKKRN